MPVVDGKSSVGITVNQSCGDQLQLLYCGSNGLLFFCSIVLGVASLSYPFVARSSPAWVRRTILVAAYGESYIVLKIYFLNKMPKTGFQKVNPFRTNCSSKVLGD